MSRSRLPFPCLCLVTDLGRSRRPLAEQVVLAVEGGVDVVHLRARELPAGELLDLAVRLKERLAGRALLVVNDRVDVALACGAQGVHLGERALPVPAVRSVAGGGLLVGRSVHSVEGAVAAQAAGADYLTVGTIYPTASKPGVAGSGTALLAEVARRVSIPFLAIGGVTADNAGACIEAGASGVAVIGALMEAPDPLAEARRLRSAMVRAQLVREQAGERR